MKQSARDLLGIRPAGTPLEDGEAWRLQCYVTNCPTATQGGWPGMAAHLEAVHYPHLGRPYLLQQARKATPLPPRKA